MLSITRCISAACSPLNSSPLVDSRVGSKIRLSVHQRGSVAERISSAARSSEPNFASDGTSSWAMIYNSPPKHLFMSPKKGAKTLLHFINRKPNPDWTAGRYYHLTKPATAEQSAPQINDPALAERLWSTTASMIEVSA